MKKWDDYKYVVCLLTYCLVAFVGDAFATLHFANRGASIALTPGESTLKIHNPNKVFGWSEESIVRSTGPTASNLWMESYGVDSEITGTTPPLLYSTSNAVDYVDMLTTANSNTLLYLDRTDSNAKLFLTKNNSNALLAGDRINSNTVLYLDRTNSNAMLFLAKNNSNALLYGDRTNSNAFAAGIKHNSDTIYIMLHSFSNTILELVERNSQALIYLNKNTSNALLYSDRCNSNAIVFLSRTTSEGIAANSNTLLFLARTQSNSLLHLAATTSELLASTSNYLAAQIRYNSNTLSYGLRIFSNSLGAAIKNVSNAIIQNEFDIHNNSQAIIYLDKTMRTNSNAFAYDIKNNSNTILYVLNNSSAGDTVLSRATSNALLFLTKNNSNAIAWIDRQVQTIDHGPNDIIINTPSYVFDHDVYASSDHNVFITSGCVIDGRGHALYLSDNASDVVQVLGSDTVEFTNIVVKNFSESAFALDTDAQVIFGDGVRLELNQQQALAQQWKFSGVTQINGLGNQLMIYPGGVMEVAPNGRLSIESVNLLGLYSGRIVCDNDNASVVFRDSDVAMARNFSFTSGALEFDGDVRITGTCIFSFATAATSTINSQSCVYFDNTTCMYAPPVAKRNLLAFGDNTACMYLDGSNLIVTTTGMQLTKGELIVDQRCRIFNDFATSISQGIVIGDGNPINDFSITIKPGASLQFDSGIIDYRDFDPS
jgi:hypothetical protein